MPHVPHAGYGTQTGPGAADGPAQAKHNQDPIFHLHGQRRLDPQTGAAKFRHQTLHERGHMFEGRT